MENKEKTILEWLESAPDEWKQKALDNHNTIPMLSYKTEKFKSLYEALSAAFYFRDSKEGRNYWNKVLITLEG